MKPALIPDDNVGLLAQAGMTAVKEMVGLYFPEEAAGFDNLSWSQEAAKLYQVLTKVLEGQLAPRPFVLYLSDDRSVRGRGSRMFDLVRGAFGPTDVRVRDWNELALESQYQVAQEALLKYCRDASQMLNGGAADADAFFKIFQGGNIEDSRMILESLGNHARARFQSLSPTDPERQDMRRAAPAISSGWYLLGNVILGEQKSLPPQR